MDNDSVSEADPIVIESVRWVNIDGEVEHVYPDIDRVWLAPKGEAVLATVGKSGGWYEPID